MAKTKYAAVSPATSVTTNGDKDMSEGEVERSKDGDCEVSLVSSVGKASSCATPWFVICTIRASIPRWSITL